MVRRRIAPQSIGLALVALALVAGAAAVARLPASHVDGYTVLWALPAKSALGTFEMGIRSEERSPTGTVRDGALGAKVLLRRRITLKPGATWRGHGSVGAPGQFGSRYVSFTLARTSQPTVTYRSVHLLFGVPGA